MPALAAILVAAALFAFFRFAPLGKAIRACADNYTGALVVGLDVKRLYALSFGLGAACVGAAGAIIVLIVDVTPPLGPAYTLLAFVIVIIGGLGSMPGALLGGVLIGVTEAMAGLFFTPSAKSMFAFAILVLVLLFRPQGIMGKRLHDRPSASRRSAPRPGPAGGGAGGPDRRAGVRQRLPAHRAHPHSLFRLHRPGLEHPDGLCRAAVARTCALCRARRLHHGGALRAFRHRTLARHAGRDPDLGRLRRHHRLPGVPLRRGGRLFRHPDHRVRRVRPHRLRSLRLGRRLRPACSCRSRTTPATISSTCAASR